MSGFMNGKGAFLTLFIGGVKQEPLEVESWDLGPVVEKIEDNVCGEDRARLDREISHYTLSLSCFNSTASKLKAMLQYDESVDANEQPSVDLGLRLTDKRNGRSLLSCTEGCIDDWKWAVGGRTARQKLTIPIRVRYAKPIA
ncbi:hypothetical protein [Sorangium sp. So ce233]|uniref:hypothetical protein n=1 Tax=Sorangium sp. So ce233 TaxID=3133290 RepID=UPI003F62E4A7